MMITNMKNKTILRMCIVCREMKDRTLLTRVVRTPDREILLDKTGKAQGRGAYICKSPECVKKIKKSRGLERSFKTSIPESFYITITKEMDEA